MTSSKGHKYENELASQIYHETNGNLLPIRGGYSGNQVVPCPDLLINDGIATHALEVKRTSQDDTFIVDLDDDIKPLVEFAREYPATTYPYIAVKFNNRQIILVPIYVTEIAINDHPDWQKVVNESAKLAPVEAKRTRTDNLSISKPDTVDWPSARRGDDVEYIVKTIGVNKRRPDLLPTNNDKYNLDAIQDKR